MHHNSPSTVEAITTWERLNLIIQHSHAAQGWIHSWTLWGEGIIQNWALGGHSLL